MSKKFLDSAGVSTLWARIRTELETKQEAINALNTTVGEHTTAIDEHTTAIATLNGDAETAGSVANTATAIAAAKVAEIVAGADASYDTLKEIADWITNDTTGAADMANDIAALQGLVGDKAVATQIAEAIAAEDLDKYALASDLNALANRVKILEDADYATETAVTEALKEAKEYADGLAGNYDTKGSADAALASAKTYSDGNLATAKAYTDSELATIVPLTTEEIEAAIAAANA